MQYKTNKKFYISESTGAVRYLTSDTKFSDIHRGLIFSNLDTLSLYMRNTYNTFLDKCYYEDIFSPIIKEELKPLQKKYILYKNRIDKFKHIINRYDYDWQRLEKVNKRYMDKRIEMTLVRLEFQEKLAMIWEKRSGRDFSPFTKQIYSELEGTTTYTKDWEEAQNLAKEWQNIKIKYEKELNKLKIEYKTKFERCEDIADKRRFYKFQSRLPILRAKYIEEKYKLILSTPRPDLVLKNKIYTLDSFPIDKIRFDNEGYNILILQENMVKRVRYIIPYNKSYKLFSVDGVLFNNNIKIIIATELKGEKVELKNYYSFYQTKTTESRKTKKLVE